MLTSMLGGSNDVVNPTELVTVLGTKSQADVKPHPWHHSTLEALVYYKPSRTEPMVSQECHKQNPRAIYCKGQA